MKKRIISVFFAVLLVFVLGAAAYADYSEGYFYYTIENESVTITGCFGRQEELTVPNMIAGCPVNHIAAGAFTGNQYLKVVNLPDTIMSIEEGAFDSSITVNMSAVIEAEPETPVTTEEPAAETTAAPAGETAVPVSSPTETSAPADPEAPEALHLEGSAVDDFLNELDEEESASTPAADVGDGEAEASEEPDTETGAAASAAKPAQTAETDTGNAAESGGEEEQQQSSLLWLWCVLGLVVLAAAAFVFVLVKNKKKP